MKEKKEIHSNSHVIKTEYNHSIYIHMRGEAGKSLNKADVDIMQQCIYACMPRNHVDTRE